MMTDIAIIGAGPAGVTAAIYALRAGLRVTIIEKNIYGGQTSIIDQIENYPGFVKISGTDFSNALYEQATKLGAKFVFSEVTDVDLTGELKCINTSSEENIHAGAVVIANGLKRRTLGCKGEREFLGKGVSYCATCDGAFFKGKSAVVIGGGNTALEDALYLSNICDKVTMIVRKDYFRGENFLINSVENTSNIQVIFNTRVKEIQGQDFVKSVIIEITDKGDSIIDTDSVFIAIGYQPDNEIYRAEIKLSESGYFNSDEKCLTNIAGVYVAGDCRIKPLRQIATAISDGAVAGNAAAAFVLNAVKNQKIRVN